MGRLTGMDAITAGLDRQHLIVTGGGASPNDSNGIPWTARCMVASGNLNAESQGRLQVCRLYEMTDDPGVRDMLSFLIARDTMHQNQGIAAIAEIEAEGLDATPVPANFPRDLEKREVAYQFWNLSDGIESGEGCWASGPAPDGGGSFAYIANPEPIADAPLLGPPDPRLHASVDGMPGKITEVPCMTEQTSARAPEKAETV